MLFIAAYTPIWLKYGSTSPEFQITFIKIIRAPIFVLKLQPTEKAKTTQTVNNFVVLCVAAYVTKFYIN